MGTELRRRDGRASAPVAPTFTASLLAVKVIGPVSQRNPPSGFGPISVIIRPGSIRSPTTPPALDGTKGATPDATTEAAVELVYGGLARCLEGLLKAFWP